MKVLIVGSGAREHTIVAKCLESDSAHRVFCAPGNAGIARVARCVDIKADNIKGLAAFAKDERVDLTIVGPELPLTLGIVDRFEEEGLLILGPSKEAAFIEESKIFAKNIFASRDSLKHVTAHYEIFANLDNAKIYIERYIGEFGNPLVIKANGLASGKGVVIAHTAEEGCVAVERLMNEEGHKLILIEEKLKGWECSFTVLTDGHNVLPLPVSCDYKQDLQGNNTGGMGAYSPVNTLSADHYYVILGYIRQVLEVLREMGRTYKGFLYAGVMITESGPKILEFNCRLGDPEAQVILPLLKSDFVELCYFAAQGNQNATRDIEWSKDAIVNVVLASPGYPEKAKKGLRIYGEQEAIGEGAVVLHGATKLNNAGNLVTDGGRVLSIVSRAETLEEARETAYRAVRKISFGNKNSKKGKQWYRDDIALDI